jgi:hypothetical protein
MVNENKISQDLLDNIEKIKAQLLLRVSKGNFTQSDIINLAGQIDFFEELKSLGYGDLLEEYFKNYEQVILDIKKQADALGIKVGASFADLDKFIDVKFDELLGRANQYGKELKSELLKNLITGVSPNEIANNLSEVPLTNTQLRVAVNTGIAEFERIGTAKIFEDAPETRFILSGPNDIRTRASCEAVLRYQPKEGWTKQEIDNGAATKLVKEHAKEFAESPSQLEQALKNPYTFVDCGKWGCRHRFIVKE